MIEKFLLRAPAGDLKHCNTSLPILLSLPLHLLLPHLKTPHLQMSPLPLPNRCPFFPSFPFLSTRTWRSASATTTTPSCSRSERLTVTASRRSSSSRSRSSKHSALNWRMRAKPCWVSSPPFFHDLLGAFLEIFLAAARRVQISARLPTPSQGFSAKRSKNPPFDTTCFEIWVPSFLQTFLGLNMRHERQSHTFAHTVSVERWEASSPSFILASADENLLRKIQTDSFVYIKV